MPRTSTRTRRRTNYRDLVNRNDADVTAALRGGKRRVLSDADKYAKLRKDIAARKKREAKQQLAEEKRLEKAIACLLEQERKLQRQEQKRLKAQAARPMNILDNHDSEDAFRVSAKAYMRDHMEECERLVNQPNILEWYVFSQKLVLLKLM